ncbi:MAG TPA: HAD family hydrolase [Candidatus Limnocylindria bacterium]|nr:HAD family hydrolase [Candidatus Limnocylindria bacterium]
MPVRAVFFDVGDTLVEHWAPTERLHELLREALRREFGDRGWYERWIAGEIRPDGVGRGGQSIEPIVDEQALRQETLRWYEEWFRNAQIGLDDIATDRLRSVMSVPLDLVSTPVAGAFDAVRWCKAKGLAVVLVSNTLSRGDDEMRADWRRYGLADAIDGYVSSHSVGWQKPHREIYERALQVARVAPDEAVMVGDRLDADIWGAKRLGIRAVLRRTPHEQAEVDATPDAVIDDLTALPGVLASWLGVPIEKG